MVFLGMILMHNCSCLENLISMLTDGSIDVRSVKHRHILDPQQEVLLHTVVIQDIEEVVIRPLGYQWSPPISVPKLHDSYDQNRLLTPEQRQAFLFIILLSGIIPHIDLHILNFSQSSD